MLVIMDIITARMCEVFYYNYASACFLKGVTRKRNRKYGNRKS